MKLKELQWKIRYAFFLWKHSKASASFCWTSAVVGMEENADWASESPIDCAYAELACWSD